MRHSKGLLDTAAKPRKWLAFFVLATIAILSACGGETIAPTATTTAAEATSTSTATPTPVIPVTTSRQQMSGTAPLTIQFSVLDAPGIVSAEWDFGDGNTSSELAPEYTFSNPGTYEVSVNAKSESASAVVIYTVNVLSPPLVVAPTSTIAPPSPTQTPQPPAPTATTRPAVTSAPAATSTPVPQPTATQQPAIIVTVIVEQTAGPAPTVALAATAVPFDASLPQPKSQPGMAVIATSIELGAQNGNNDSGPPDFLKEIGISETLFRRADDDTLLPSLATGFSIASDLSSATIELKAGVSFHTVDNNDFGELTAHDVAFAMNESNWHTNPASQHKQAKDFVGIFDRWEAVDDLAVNFNFLSYDSSWADNLINHSGESFSVFSKQAFDQMGQDWAINNIVATGVYQVESWTTNNQITLISRPNHHQFEAKTERVQLIQVQEPETRTAMLRTGEADIANLEVVEVRDFGLTGFTQTSASSRQYGMFFSGNLWEDVYAVGELQGQPLPTKATFVHDIPWIGAPGKHGNDDLGQAKAIRRAMAIAIDREKIKRDVLGGLGSVNHVTYFSADHPNWDSRYEYRYDPAGAISLIRQQDRDYQRGSAPSDGILGDHAFEVSFYATPSPSSVAYDIADAVAGFWSDIGLTVFTLKYSYQTFRPGVVGRTNSLPWITSCAHGNGSYAWQSWKGHVQTTVTRGAYSCGFESPVILDLYWRMLQASDSARATAAANDYLEYVYDQVLQPGLVEVPNAYYFNPRKIKSFKMEKSRLARLTALWNIELQ